MRSRPHQWLLRVYRQKNTRVATRRLKPLKGIPAISSAQHEGTIPAPIQRAGADLRSAVIVKMNQGLSLHETIARGRRHYYNGLTYRNWKLTMLKMYGGDTRPFLDDAWNAITGDAESRVYTSRDKEPANNKRVRAGTSASARPLGPINFLGQLTMVALNGVACVMLLGACLSRLPFPDYPRLRWICFAAFTFTAVWRMKDGAAIICLPLAFLFNPFFLVRLSHNMWTLIDVVSLILFLAMSASFIANGKK